MFSMEGFRLVRTNTTKSTTRTFLPPARNQLLTLTTVFAFLVACVQGNTGSSSQPKLSLNLKSDPEYPGALGMVEPRLQWSGSSVFRGMDVEGGLDVQLHDADEIPPINVWASVRKQLDIRDFLWKVQGSLEACLDHGLSLANLPSRTRLLFRASSEELNTHLQIDGQILAEEDEEVEIKAGQVRWAQVIENPFGTAGTWTVIPQYHLSDRRGDLKIAYTFEDESTTIELDTSTSSPNRLSVIQKISDENDADQISPSFTTEGDVELEYRKQLGKGILTTRFKPNKFLHVRWEEGPWEASLQAPMEGVHFTEAPKLNLRRSM